MQHDISNIRTNPKKGATTPSSASSGAKEESGWDYWTRVYSEDLPVPAVHDVRIADVFRSDLLVRAKLLFLNVPPLASLHKNIVLGLVRRELLGAISIQDVDLQPGRWFMNFYRPEDALRVLQKFNGFAYRAHVLQVRFCYPDGTYGDESALSELVRCTHNNQKQSKMFEQKEIVQETIFAECWTSAEHASLLDFEHELELLLQSHQCMPYQQVIHTLRLKFAGTPSIIPDALLHWSTGLIRVFSRTVKVVSNTMCLASGPYYAQRIRDSVMADGVCSVHRNAWEPCTPDEIRTDVHLKQYAIAFLKHFGPQHIEIDAPLRILGHSLRGTWPKTGPELGALLTRLSSEFVIVNDVVYLTSCDAHVELIVDNLAAFQDDCKELYYLPLANSTAAVSDDRKAKLAPFDDL